MTGREGHVETSSGTGKALRDPKGHIAHTEVGHMHSSDAPQRGVYE